MPNSGRYPCGNCSYVAASRRMLSRHTAIAHAAQAFKCPLCPFVSCYQANLYRHKRDIHGLGRMTACEICGFFSSSIEDLIEHKENNHQDQIEWLKKKYANERVRLGVEIREEADVKSTDGENLSVEKETEVTKPDCLPNENHENIEDTALEDQNGNEVFNKLSDTSSEMKSGQLGPIKIRRSYTCEECGLTTIDPREYLYHRRDVHGEKMTVHECKYCIYASRHVQKLQRHCALVHRQQMQIKKNTTNKNAEMGSVKESSDAAVSKVIDDVVENWKCVTTDEEQVNAIITEKQLTARKTMPVKLMKCSECPFEAYNSLHLLEHEKDAHRRKKDYECVQCGYGTNNKSRFTRHLKYHDVPKLKCSFCDFKTPYKWNMDRHLRNHVENGEYECKKCSFKTHAKQSLTVHLDYHHGNASFNSKAKRPRLQTARKQKVLDREAFDEFYSNNVAFNDYIDDEEDNDDADILNEDTRYIAMDESVLQKNPYSFQSTSETNTKKQLSYGSSKQHSCPICDAKFSHLSWLGQHLKEGHPESADASNIAAVVDMLSPQKHKIREILTSTPLSGPFTTSKKSQLENKDRSVPTCKICGYKTRWVSELLKHERVHSGEKPFECHICEYKCKWKGDLTRHLQKFHKKRQQIMPKISTTAEEAGVSIVPNHKQMCSTDGSNSEDLCSSTPVSFNSDQDSPLDLTVTKKLPELVLLPALLGNVNKSINNFNFPKEKPRFTPKQNSFPVKRQLSEYEIINERPSKVIKKYKCTFCGFMTRTASRFHVHMVQHFDKRPFVCSACGYRSNWQWDITKHIKMKSARDDSHVNATLVITDQTGEKNYEKYKSYLVDVEENKESKRVMRISNRVEKKRLQHNVDKNDDDEYDNNCSDMTSVIDEPENIVVTPDLPFSFEDPNQSRPDFTSANEELVVEPYQSRPVFNNDIVNGPAFERYKLFHCKHCSYKHREKKVVVSHLAVHAGIKLFRCRVCGVSSNWKNVILRHVKTHHSGQLKYVEELITYTVEGHVVCLTGIKKQQENISSLPVSSPRRDTTRRCTICPYTCVKENHFQFHMKQHQPREGTCFKCMFCPYYVKFRKTLIRHLELHKNESNERTEPTQYLEEDNADPAELFMNENCDNEVSIDVQNQHRSASDWSCDEKQVNCKDIYFREKRHSCEQCPYKTDNKTQYLYHKQFHRPNKSAKFKCKLCSYWATHHHLIAQHLKVHNTDQPFSLVDNQSNEFVQSSHEIEDNQSVEIPANEDENKQIRSVFIKKGGMFFRMFKCNYCPMMNKRRANVRVHEKMHSKSKVSKYVCPLCNYKCNNQGIITAHMKIHENNSESLVLGCNNDMTTTENLADDACQPPPPLKRKRVFSYFCMKCPAVFKSTADMEIHKTFHGMSYPLPCHSCDYRARNKAHLHKHLLVHTPEYVAKREASYGPPVVTTIPETTSLIKSSEANQMLLLEDAEMKAVMEGSVIHSPQKLHRCTHCPVAFFKATTLQYHLSLHGSNGEYVCSHCNYAVDKNENLSSHEKFHISPPKLVKPKAPTMFFSCPKCPAIFDKVNRYNRHLRLHGQKNKHTCEHCDYSVRLPANLFNHKIVHTKSYAERKQDISFVSQEASALGITLSLERKNLEESQKKRSFVCDRCPYFYMRKDAVQRHQRRHNSGGGGGCPYCDYNSLQLSFLRDHIRVHFQSESPFQAQAFMKHEEYEIWSVEDGKRELLFKDNGAHKSNSDRFFPPLNKEMGDLYAAEDEAPNDLSVIEYKEMDNIPNKNDVPVVSPISFNADLELEQLPALQGTSEPSSHQPTSNTEERNDLIEDALNQSKKLEVILTDVFSGGNKAVIMNAMNNEAVTEESNVEQDILLEERNLVQVETKQASPMLINLEDANVKIEEKSKSVEESSDYQPEKTTVNLTELECEVISSDVPISPHTNDINIYVIKSETPRLNETCEISCNNCYTIKEELFIGTNNSSFDADIEKNEKLELSSSSDYFDTRKTEFINEEKTGIPDSAASEMEDNTSLGIVNNVTSDGCDNIIDAEVEVTITSDDQLIENVSESVFLDTATLEKCHRNGLISENDSNILPDPLLPM